MKKNKKPKLAVWKFASCDGCQLSLLDCEDELLAVAGEIEIANFSEASRKIVKGPYDLSLVEGSITTPHDEVRIHEVRRASKFLVTIGACATAGGIQALRNFKDVKEFISIVYAHPEYISTLNKSTPIADHVRVDFELRGCPINKDQLLDVIRAYLHGSKPNTPAYSVCLECKRRGTVCVMVAHGTPCLGPITHDGCGAICPSYNRGCYGCFGPKETPNTDALTARFTQLGAADLDIVRVLRNFNAGAEAFRLESEAHEKKSTKTRTFRVDLLARVEGEGALYVKIKGDAVVDVKLKIFEPPRFFEAFLRGRTVMEAADIASRICGICPIAYQMSTVHAVEDAIGLKVDGQLRALRRLIYCGEWIESHTLHVYMLHAPDFLGYPDAIEMAKDHPEIVQRGLKLKKAGNEIIRLLGGREIHPINVRVGGFYKVPSKSSLRSLEEQLKWARDAALETVRWAATMPFPDFEQDFLFVALRHEAEYPFNEGRVVSNRGLDIPVREYEHFFSEQHIAYSTALHSTLNDFPAYFVGPMARYNLNFDRLSPLTQETARSVNLQNGCKNPFQSIVVRSLEILYACDEALRIIEQYEMPEKPAASPKLKAGTGYACTEAPRGILYHRFQFDEQGTILDAKIVPPTSQNQRAIENDLRQFVPQNLNLSDEELRRQCEQVVRNYDPCISCSTHFLKLQIERS